MREKTMPKLILCDVDGTLIEPSEEITPAFDELKTLIKQNHLRFSLASGRSLELIAAFMKKLEITDPVLINNGAGAREEGTVLWDEWFPARYVKEAIIAADQMDMAIFMCHGDYETVYRHNAYVQREIDVFGRYNHFYIPLKSEWEELKLERVMLTDPKKPGTIRDLLPYLEPYRDQLEIIVYDDRHIDVMNKGVSKGNALQRLSAEKHIALEDIMVIGDGVNDLEMFREAGISVAVGNTNPLLKNEADYICSACYTKGVIEAIRHYCVDGE